jgi:hypothetical protein
MKALVSRRTTTTTRLPSNSKGWICPGQRRAYVTLFGCLVLSSLTLFQQIFQVRYSYSQLSGISHYSWLETASDQSISPTTAENHETKETDNFDPLSSVAATSLGSVALKKGRKPTRGCNSHPLLEPVWEWHNFSRNQNAREPEQNRLLIAQYSGNIGNYSQLLEKVAPINKAYARKWNHDFVILQGTTFIIPNDRHCNPPEERSRFNKLHLLDMALSMSTNYDQLLLLDADAMIYDFTFDITKLVTNQTMLVAQRVHDYDPPQTWNVNNGVTLWNLHHPLTATVANAWTKACKTGLPDNRPFRGDQFYLHKVLKEENYSLAVAGVWNEFYYRDGTVVKHFQRSNMLSWNDTGLDVRLERMERVAQEICDRFNETCETLVNTNATPSVAHSVVELTHAAIQQSKIQETLSSTECSPRRHPVVEWRYNGNSTTSSKRRLLIAQYSGFESGYSRLLELSSPINKAYAKKWGHDLVILHGATLTLPKDRQCEPPQNRSMYNKLTLLHLALSKATEYDHLLVLDADAIVYDFDFDITELLADDELLAAHRVKKEDKLKTWNINNGVCLWNLRHPFAAQLALRWYEGIRVGLSRGEIEHGDQHYLQVALKQWGGESYVHSLPIEFKYEKGTIVKHFIRQDMTLWDDQDLSSREELIKNTRDEVCERHPSSCLNLENTDSTNHGMSYLPSTNRKDQEAKTLLKLSDEYLQVWNVSFLEPLLCRDSTRHTPVLEWVFNFANLTSNHPYPSRRLLVAQYSSPGNYSRLLELTTPINQAYARKWGHDFVILRGTALVLDKDGPCEPPKERSGHNKLYLLEMALSKWNEYDQLLILDADALIYDFDRDVTALLTDGDMLAAQRVNETDEPRTWNINNGVCLWNLRHPLTKRISFDWLRRTREGLDRIGEKEHGDQHYLQTTLRKRNRRSFVNALATEFHYKKATVIKHFVRTNNDIWNDADIEPREGLIEAAIKEVCLRHQSDCDNVKWPGR